MTTPASPPSRCACGKFSLPSEAAARGQVTYLLVFHGLYRDYYRCALPEGGWHLRDVKKRLAKVQRLGSAGREEAAKLEATIRRLDLLAQNGHPTSKKSHRHPPLDTQLRQLPPAGKKPEGRRGTLRRAARDRSEDDEARVRGSRGTSVTNELRRRSERARLREELLREEKDT